MKFIQNISLTIFILTFMSNLHSQVSDSNLVLHYVFNGNADDVSGNSNHGFLMGTIETEDSCGTQNRAYLFDGINDYIKLNHANPVISSGNFTISAWVKMNGQGGGANNQNFIFEQRDDNSSVTTKSTITFQCQGVGNTAKIAIRPSGNINGASTVVSAQAMPYGEWHFYAAALDSNQILHLYIDSLELGNTAYTQSGNFHTSIDHVNFGSHHYAGGLKGLLNGEMDNIRIYSRGLDSLEIMELFDEGPCIEVQNFDTIIVYDTTLITVYDTTYISLYDTISTEIFDTTFVTIIDSISVTDTLYIDVLLSSPNQVVNTIRIYPNPAHDYVVINTGNYFQNIQNYQIRIENTLGQLVFESFINQAEFELSVNEFGDYGTYIITIINEFNSIIEKRKIILH